MSSGIGGVWLKRADDLSEKLAIPRKSEFTAANPILYTMNIPLLSGNLITINTSLHLTSE